MRKFIVLSVVIVFIGTLSVGASVLPSRAQPDLSILTALRLTDCVAPCWIGILPGETPLSVARNQIINVFWRSGFFVTFDLTSGPGLLWANLERQNDPLDIIQVTFNARPTDSVINSITLDFQSAHFRDRATVADVIRLFGPPSRLALPSPVLGPIDNLGLLYGGADQGMVVFFSPRNAVQWSEQVVSVVLYARRQLPLARSVTLRPWLGFRPLSQYYAVGR